MLKVKGHQILELPSTEVLFLKKFQNNGFYPLEKAVRVSNGWTIFSHKTGGWSKGHLFYTDERFLYLLKNNAYLVTDFPMKNSDEFNFE